MGISVGRNALVIVSAKSRSMPPPTKQAGRSALLSGPTINRRRWGMMRPTNPIIPETDTQAAVIRDALINNTLRTFSVSIPRASDVLEPRDIIFMSLE